MVKSEDDPEIEDEVLVEAYVRELKRISSEYFRLIGKLPGEVNVSFVGEKNPYVFADLLSSALLVDVEQKQEVLEEIDLTRRLSLLLSVMHHEIAILKVERDISSKVKTKIDDNQKDFYLREQLKVIREELGDDTGNEYDIYLKESENKKFPEGIRDKFLKELDKLSKTQSSSPEATVIRNYLDLLLEIPWGIKSEETDDISIFWKTVIMDSIRSRKG